MDELPPELSDHELAELEALALRKLLPSALTPSELIALAYPDTSAKRERRALLHAICAALDAAELMPARQPKPLADLPAPIAARWKEDRPPFNPDIRTMPFFVGIGSDPLEVQQLEHGYPVPNFNIPIAREDFTAWARGLGLGLPGYTHLRTLAPDDPNARRATGIGVLAEMNRLPAWLRREEVLCLWTTPLQIKADPSLKARANANRLLLDEAIANGQLKHHRHTFQQPTKVSKIIGHQPGWMDPEVLHPVHETYLEMQPAVALSVHRDDMHEWLGQRKIELPAWSLLRHWWPWILNETFAEAAPDAAEKTLREKRSDFGKSGQAGRQKKDWRPLVAEGHALMRAQNLSASDAARQLAAKHGLTGTRSPMSGQVKTLANKLTEGGAANSRKG